MSVMSNPIVESPRFVGMYQQNLGVVIAELFQLYQKCVLFSQTLLMVHGWLTSHDVRMGFLMRSLFNYCYIAVLMEKWRSREE